MCGFAGVINWANEGHSGAAREEIVTNMASTLALRGPDSKGVFVDEVIALGHRRLKVIDLSENGAQPMQVREDGPVVAYNGEIYNFRLLRDELISLGYVFRGDSDTEVILNVYDKWGLEGLARLEGVFAYALWDPSREILTLTRDRLGIKPLFYAESSMGLAFGSEIKALLAAGGVDTSLSNQAFSEYLWFGNTHEDRSFYNGVKALLPGQRLIIDKNSRRLEYWWKIEKNLENPLEETSFDKATEMVQQALDASVKRQLVSDVPIGIFLSGGVDSSAIAASASRVRPNELNSYSASFDFDEGIDESEKALLVAKHLGLNHHQLRICGADISEVMVILARAHDEPFADAANIPLYLMCKQLDPAVKVVLQGDGGDELFAGYRRYQILNNHKYFKFFPSYLNYVFRNTGKYGARAARIYDAIKSSDPAMRMAMLLTVETLFNNPTSLLTEEKRQELSSSTDSFLAYRRAADRFKEKDPIQQMLLTDLTVQLPSQFLTKVDRATMAAGIEARVPLLDENMLRLSLRMPTKWKVDNKQNKIILRNSQRGRLPASILDGPKTGFGVPYQFWLRSSLYDFSRERLLNPQFTDFFGLNGRLLEMKIQEHLRGDFEHGFLLWKLLQLALWLETRN